MDTRSLREENELLRERVLQLEEMLKPPPVRVVGFQPLDMKILTAIAKREHGISYDGLLEILYGDRHEDKWPKRQLLTMKLTVARKILAARHPTITVQTVWGWGFKMDRDSRRAWLALVERSA